MSNIDLRFGVKVFWRFIVSIGMESLNESVDIKGKAKEKGRLTFYFFY